MKLFHGKLHLFLMLLTTSAVMSDNLFSQIDHFIRTLMFGVKYTTQYTVFLGQKYPPLDVDVTIWCVKPNETELIQTYFDDPEIKSKIDFTLPVAMLIHGWLGGIHDGNRFLSTAGRAKEGWMWRTSVEWAKEGRINVCAVDWSGLSNYDYSVSAMKHTEMVANALEMFIKNDLIKTGMDIRKFELAGHSLGAQIGARLGLIFKGAIKAIYGLDPAGPGFTFPFDFGRKTRLDSSDAQYVQCILTSRGTFGTFKDCGHATFIINPPAFNQPGCNTPLCSHSRAHEIFREALNPSAVFMAEKCRGSVQLFIKSIFKMPCSSVTDRLGIHSSKFSGRFFMKTRASAPFALSTVN